MTDDKKILEFITRLIDDTNSNNGRTSWNWVDCVGKSGGYHTDYDDEYHLFISIDNSKGTSHRLELFEINGIPIGEINSIDSLNVLYDAILTQIGQNQQDIE